jgi:FkbM family methyltransferase
MLAEQKLGLYGTAGQGVQPGDVVMDCGACLGLYTLRALSSGAARVIAIEPSPVNRECLRRNVEMHGGRDRVTIVPAGIWDRRAELRLRMQAGNPAADSVALTYRGSREGPLVDVGPIDDLVRELELRQLDWIKMDVEGAERAGLQGARETLRRFQPRLVVAMEHRFDDPREIPRLVASIADGYRCEPGPCVDVGNALRPAVITFR